MDPRDYLTPEILEILAQRIVPPEGEGAVGPPGRPPHDTFTAYDEAKRERLSEEREVPQREGSPGNETTGEGSMAGKDVVSIVTAVLSEAKGSEELREAGLSVARMARNVATTIEVGLLPLAAVYHGYSKAKAYFERRFPAEMAERMATIPQQRLVEPQPFVAAKAVEGLAYSHEESELREMYLSLLATAMDSSTAAKAHPAFAKIIHELSPGDARFFNRYALRSRVPIVNLVYRHGGRSQTTLLPALLDTRDDNGEQVYIPQGLPEAIVNWDRLGLVCVTYAIRLASDDAYDWVKTHPEYTVQDRRALVARARDEEALYVEKGVLDVTPFGEQFIRAVQANRPAHRTA